MRKFIGSAFWGLAASISQLLLFFWVVSLISGADFAKEQFFTYWYFFIALALGFGIQVALYRYLRSLVRAGNKSKGVLAATGTTSTVSMISCCSHYLVNILPVLGVTGFIAIVSQYQVELFWVGLAANLLGMIYMANKVFRFSNEKSQ